MAKIRQIGMGVPSGTMRLLLYEGTEDECWRRIYGINDRPYVKDGGIKYYLTTEEVAAMRQLKQALEGCRIV